MGQLGYGTCDTCDACDQTGDAANSHNDATGAAGKRLQGVPHFPRVPQTPRVVPRVLFAEEGRGGGGNIGGDGDGGTDVTVHVACGELHTVFSCGERIWGCGGTKHGKLGLGAGRASSGSGENRPTVVGGSKEGSAPSTLPPPTGTCPTPTELPCLLPTASSSSSWVVGGVAAGSNHTLAFVDSGTVGSDSL